MFFIQNCRGQFSISKRHTPCKKSKSMSDTSPVDDIKKKMTINATLIKRWQAMDSLSKNHLCPLNDELVIEGQRLSHRITKTDWVIDKKFNEGKNFEKVEEMSTDNLHDTSWFGPEDKEDTETGLWIESKEQLENKLKQDKANLEEVMSKLVENESKIDKIILVGGEISDLLNTTMDTEEEAILVQVICDQLSELEALCLESDLAKFRL